MLARSLIVLAATALAGCSSREPPLAPSASASRTAAPAEAPPAEPPTPAEPPAPVTATEPGPAPATGAGADATDAGSGTTASAPQPAGAGDRPSFGVDVEAELQRLRTAEPQSFRVIGTTSLTFRVVFTDGSCGAFKPRRTPGINGWKAEVAAYRLARLLELGNVPPTIGRRFRRRDVERQLAGAIGSERATTELSRIVWERNGSEVLGAAILWIHGLQPSNLDGREGMGRWQRALRHGGGLEEADRPLYAQLADLLLFDYLTANADRWSGANVGLDGTGRVLVFRDNDSAFPDRTNRTRLERVWSRLRQTQRFSRRLVERLRAISREDVARVMAEDPEGVMLDDGQIDELMERREAALSYVQALIGANGEDATLYFP